MIVSLSKFREIEKTANKIPVPIQLSGDRVLLMPDGNQTAENYIKEHNPELLNEYQTSRDERRKNLSQLKRFF